MTQEKLFGNRMLIIQNEANLDEKSSHEGDYQMYKETAIFSVPSKKCRRKPLKNGVCYKQATKNTSNEISINTNNNSRPSLSIQKLKTSSIKLSTEVIDIEKECVRAKASSNHERHGIKRKKASIDQLLSKVEAKHSKLEETLYRTFRSNSSSSSRRSSDESSDIATQRVPVNRDNYETVEHYPPMLCVSSGTTATTNNHFNNKNSKSLSVTRIKQTPTKRTKDRAAKPNKRTLSTNERYSKLTSTQLQRRLVANARERSRVHALSNAFDALRCTIPSYSTEQKLSKLTILRVAINYINALDQLLAPTSPIDGQKQFGKYVDECTAVLQTEYGRSKNK